MDKALKQRLVGAVVLIALAVIVLPMIFGGRPSGTASEPGSIELPAAPPDLKFETRRFPVGDEPGREPAPEDAQAPDLSDAKRVSPLEQPDTPVGETDPQEAKVVQNQAAETHEGAGDAGDASEAVAGEGMENLAAGLVASETADSSHRYVVQVASFGNTGNAVRLAGRLEEAGYAVLLDHLSSETGQLNRVRVGPYAKESEAQEVAGQLRERFSGINPRIVDMQPDDAVPSLASEDPLMRWVVQVGSFSSEDNARQLVARLRESGLSAYDETVSTDNSTIHRVRVGPYLDRAEALEAERQISEGIGIDGVVMSSD